MEIGQRTTVFMPVPAWVGTATFRLPTVRGVCLCEKIAPKRVLRKGRVFDATMAADRTSANVDEYAQFANMLGDGSAPVPESKEALLPDSNEVSEENSAKDRSYAEFSEMLGLEDKQYKSAEGKKTVAEAAQKSNSIDPADYDVFDTLLQRSGGRGRKPIKGSKRYATQTELPQKSTIGSETSLLGDSEVESSGQMARNEHSADVPERKSSPRLTEEETAEAYAIMAEEFGVGVHASSRSLETRSTTMHIGEKGRAEKKLLLEPPTRPGRIDEKARVENNATVPKKTYPEANPFSAEMPSEPSIPSLKPKPSTPDERQKVEAEERKKDAMATIEEAYPYSFPEVTTAPTSHRPAPRLQPKPAMIAEENSDDEVLPASKGPEALTSGEAQNNPFYPECTAENPAPASAAAKIVNRLQMPPRRPESAVARRPMVAVDKDAPDVALHPSVNTAVEERGRTVSRRTEGCEGGKMIDGPSALKSKMQPRRGSAPAKVLRDPKLIYAID